MVRLTGDAAVDAATTNAPPDTRAAIRGALVERFADNIGVASWNKIVLRSDQESWVADLDPYLTPEDVAPELAKIVAAPDLVSLLRRYREQGRK